MCTKTHHKEAFGSDTVLFAEIKNLSRILSTDMAVNHLTLIVNRVICGRSSHIGILCLDSCLFKEGRSVYACVEGLAALFEVLTVELFVLIPLFLFGDL